MENAIVCWKRNGNFERGTATRLNYAELTVIYEQRINAFA